MRFPSTVACTRTDYTRRAVCVAPPPTFNADLRHRRLLYGWKVNALEEFLKKHGRPFYDDGLYQDDIFDVVNPIAEEVGLRYHVNVFENIIWLTRNYMGLRGGIYDKALGTVPAGESLQKLVDKLGLGDPEWHVLVLDVEI